VDQARAHDLVRGRARDRLPVEEHAAGAHRQQTRERLEQGRLAGAVRADDRAQRVRFEPQGNAVQDLDPAVPRAQALDLQQRGRWRGHVPLVPR
jgi:hypothetical protein